MVINICAVQMLKENYGVEYLNPRPPRGSFGAPVEPRQYQWWEYHLHLCCDRVADYFIYTVMKVQTGVYGLMLLNNLPLGMMRCGLFYLVGLGYMVGIRE
jgi:hypothetical protein